MDELLLTPNEDARLDSLKTYNILDTDKELEYDALTALVASVCEVPIALISFMDEDRQWFKSHHGTMITETDKASSFCAYAIIQPDRLMMVEDAKKDERFKNNPLVTGDPNVIFYAGMPIVNDEGFALGALCIIDHKPKVLSQHQQTALKTLAAEVLDKLELRRKFA